MHSLKKQKETVSDIQCYCKAVNQCCMVMWQAPHFFSRGIFFSLYTPYIYILIYSLYTPPSQTMPINYFIKYSLPFLKNQTLVFSLTKNHTFRLNSEWKWTWEAGFVYSMLFLLRVAPYPRSTLVLALKCTCYVLTDGPAGGCWAIKQELGICFEWYWTECS